MNVSRAHFSVEPTNVIYGLHLGDHRYRYIGLTTKGVAHRLRTHKVASKRTPARTPVYHWMQKYGSDNVHIEIIEVCNDLSILAKREVFWIEYYRSMYPDMLNVSSGGDGALGVIRSAETRAKMSAATKGRKKTPKQIEAIKRGWVSRDRHVPQVTRDKISKSLIGNKRASGTPNTAYLTDEYKKKLSDHRKGKPNIGSHIRWHTNKNVSKPETCKFCREEMRDNDESN